MYTKYTALFGRPYHPFLKFIIVMKLTTVLILGGLLQVSAAGFSQHLTYHKKQASLEQIFREIRKQTGYTVLWSTSKIRNASPTDADFEKTPLQTVLSGLLPALDLSFEINENAILIKEKVLLPAKTAIEIADIPVKGRVVDEQNQPLAGVTVSIKGTEKATTSNADGSFSINAPENATLVFSFVGTIAQEIPIRNRGSITVKLENDQKNLEIVDVVAVGYGTQKKSEVTGASSTVTATEIAKRPLQRVEQALQGTTSGVVVQSKSGQPGNSLSVKIRGSNSITGSNEPLYVIDGYIGGNIETVNPNDIQSLEVLKDAAATAVYGSRGSNGVVLITTKIGGQGKTRVNLSAWGSRNSFPKKLDLMNAYDFARATNSQLAAVGNPAAFSESQLKDFQANPGTDWQDEIQRKPWVQNYQLDVSGGTKEFNYLISFNHLDQPGMILNQWYKRSTLRANLGMKLNEKMDLKFFINTSLPRARNNGFIGDYVDPFAQAYQFDPTLPVKNADGDYNFYSQYASIGINPVAQLLGSYGDYQATAITGTGVFTYRILNNLTFTSNNTYSNTSGLGRGVATPTGVANNGRDNAYTNNNYDRSIQSSNFLTYKQKFNEHSITVTALYEIQNYKGINNNLTARNLSSYALGYYNLGLGSTQLTTSGYNADALTSFLGRVNYGYRDKYLVTASVRTDGSSHLTEKYSTFPSFGVAWNIAKESFMDNSRLFAELKLRASYGLTGNQAVGAYATIPQITTGGPAYHFDGTTPSIATPLGSPVSQSLKWETTRSTDVGIDAAFLNGRLTFTADAYHKKIENLLFSYQAPLYLGGGSYLRNIGNLQNTGLEFSLGGTPVVTRRLRWNTNLTLSFNRNKVLGLGDLDNVVINNVGQFQNGFLLLKVGKSLGEFRGYDYLGTWKTGQEAEAAQYGSKPGDARYADLNGDFRYTGDDLTTIGNGTPKFSFGFINDLAFGNFTLSVMFQGTYGNDIYSGTIPFTLGGQGDARNATSKMILDVWTAEKQTDIPTFSSTSQNFINSSRFVYNGSYIKLKNLALNYNIGSSFLKKVSVTKLEVYVSGQNFWTITDYPGYDPEVTNAQTAMALGVESGVIPNPKTFTIGLRASF